MSVDPTREAVAAVVADASADWYVRASGPDAEPRDWQVHIADAALAVVYSQDWLTGLVRLVHDEYCESSQCDPFCAAVPSSLRAAAGLETP